MDQHNIQPLSNRLVVEPIEAETTTASGLSLPETTREKPMKGTVVATGPDITINNHVASIRPGDTVLYGKYAGVEVEIDGKSLILMKETDVFAII